MNNYAINVLDQPFAYCCWIFVTRYICRLIATIISFPSSHNIANTCDKLTFSLALVDQVTCHTKVCRHLIYTKCSPMPDCFLNLHSPTHYHHESAILILVSVSSDHPQHWFSFHVTKSRVLCVSFYSYKISCILK